MLGFRNVIQNTTWGPWMKIQNQNPVQNNIAVQSGKTKAQETVEKQSPTLPEEKVTVSQEAVNLQQIGQGLKTGLDVRMEMVNSLKAEVEAGTYQRPADQVAEAMLTNSLIESLYRR